MTDIKYIIQLTRFVNDTQDYSSRCAVQYYDKPLLFSSISEVYQWLARYGYRQTPELGKNIYSKEGRGIAKDITWDNVPVPTTYTAVVLEVNPDRKAGQYQDLALCGHAE